MWPYSDVVMYINSTGLKHFLNREWFSVVSNILKENCLTTPYLEKLSILLQRLSTLR